MKALCVVTVLAMTAALAGCYREKREFQPATGAASAADTTRMTRIHPGPGEPVQSGAMPFAEGQRDDENAFAVNQGKRLFRWYNCSGCHAQGGGNMGPPLMDDKWLYGDAPAAIYSTVVEGRPNGMPAFGGRIPEDQLWQLVAYVRSLSGQLRKDVAPSRSDGMAGAPPENVRDQERPIARANPEPRPVAPDPQARPASAPASAPKETPR